MAAQTASFPCRSLASRRLAGSGCRPRARPSAPRASSAAAEPARAAGPSEELMEVNRRLMESNTARCAAAGPAVSAAEEEYPTVDISSWLRPDSAQRSSERRGVVRAVLQAAVTRGAFNVSHHGVDLAAAQAAVAESEAFFAQPAAAKAACKGPSGLTGYTAVGTESANELHGRRGGRDLREILGQVTPESDPANRLAGGNPQADASAEALQAYGREVEGLEVVLYEVLAEALSLAKGLTPSLPGDLLLKGKCGAGGLLRVSHYPALEQLEGAVPDSDMRAGDQLPGHSDWGALTVVYAEAPGLEELHEGRWEAVPLPPGTLHVHLGDNMHLWSNGAFVNNVHRVNMTAAGREARTSIVYFSGQGRNGRDNVAIEPVCAPGEAPRFPALSVADYVEAGMRRYLGEDH